ncbi:MAG: response regulator [Rhodospirillales bacterium]|nr:response regulator [Rhodospirillales bacterium]
MNLRASQYTTARILVVDDNATNVQLLETMLSHAGYENVQTTTDPTAVLDLYKKWNFDLILLDIRMPKMDGFEVMGALRQVVNEDYLPILAITAQTDMETRLRALKEGAKDFVNKPFNHLEVLNRIENMLKIKTLNNERRWQNEILEAKVRERTVQLEERNLELHDTRLEIIRRLGRAGEYRDNETGMHVVRMSKGCQQLALAAGLGEEFSEAILNASPMHDVGKIGIPDHILLKPGKLDADEWEIMKTHSAIGADIIGEFDSEVMQMAHAIALTHHEKWDGLGYPNGLKGEGIPIVGRISAISDVFDALTSERPYKKPWTTEDALNFINENSGSQFDPDLVQVFNGIYNEILAIRTDFAD